MKSPEKGRKEKLAVKYSNTLISGSPESARKLAKGETERCPRY
jgi:hypothetical protein